MRLLSYKSNFIFLGTLMTILLPFGLSELYPDEVQSLSELPMEKLLKIRSSFIEIGDEDFEEEEKEEEGLEERTIPFPMPLRKLGNKLRRHGGWEEKGEDSKISKIFQFSLTTLSFLAFGGYLLTLIISSMRRNSGGNTGNVIVLSNLQKYTRPKRQVFGINPTDNDFNTDSFYRGMIMLSEEYASYSKFKQP